MKPIHVVRAIRRRLLSLSLVAVTACGGGTPAPADPRDVAGASRPTDPVELLPADTFAVLRADVALLRRSPYYATVKAWLEQAAQVASSEGDGATVEVLEGILGRTDVLVLGIAPGPSADAEPDIMLVLRGTYREGELEALMQSQQALGLEERPSRVEELEGRRVYVGEESAATSVDDHTWLLATGDRLSKMLARLDGRGGATPRSSPVFTDMAERVRFDRAALALVAEATPYVKAMLGSEMNRAGAAVVESFVSCGVRLDVSDGLDGSAIVETTHPVVAEAVADQAREALADASRQMVTGMLGLGAIIENTTVTVDGSTTLVALRVDDATTRATLSRVGGFVSLALQAAASGGGGLGGRRRGGRGMDDGPRGAGDP